MLPIVLNSNYDYVVLITVKSGKRINPVFSWRGSGFGIEIAKKIL